MKNWDKAGDAGLLQAGLLYLRLLPASHTLKCKLNTVCIIMGAIPYEARLSLRRDTSKQPLAGSSASQSMERPI